MGYQTADEWLKQKNGSMSSGGGKSFSGGETSSGGYQTAEDWMKQKYSPEKLEEQYTQANSWIDRYNQVITGLSNFDRKRNGGYVKDVVGGHGKEISALLRDFDGFQEYLGVLGFSDAMRYVSSLQKLQKGINDGNQFMAQFGSEEAFNQYITEREDYESKRTANIAELEQELAELEKQYREQKSVADQYQRLYEGTSWLTQKRYPEEYEALRQKGSVSLADLEADITDRKAFLEEARAIQEQEPLMAKYGGKSYRELQDIISTMNPSDREYQWVNAYAEAVMGKDDYAEEILKNTAELKYLEEGLQKIQGLADQMNMGGETEADKRKYKALVQKYGSLEDLKAEIEAPELKNWKYQNALKYGHLDENADYQEQAVQASDVKKVGVGIGFGTKWWGFGGDPVYHYINDIDGTRKAQQDQDGGTPYSVYDFMTDKHIADYNYLYNTQGKKAAQEYLDYIQYDLEHMQMQQLKKDTARFATEHPFASSSLSIPTNLASGLGVLDVAAQNLAREITGEYKPIHYERGSMAPTAFTTTTRSTVAQNIADATGIIDLNEEDHPFLSRVLNGKSLGDVYQLGMSMADSAAVAGLSLAGIPGGTALLGGSAASQGVLDALERGANDTQALSMGVLNGTFEMLFEEVSLDKLLNGRTGSIVKDILQQGGVEGSEEFFTTLANTAADILVMADKSDYKTQIAKYKEQGLDEKQATIKALEDIAIGMGWDFVGGFISGGTMGGMAMPIHTYEQGISLQKAGVTAEELSQLGGTFSPDSKVSKIAGKVNGNSGAFSIGRLYNNISTELSNRNKTDIAEILEGKGMDAKIAQKHAEILEYVAEGGTLSDTQMRMIEKNEILAETMQEVILNKDSTVNQRLREYNDATSKVRARADSGNDTRTSQEAAVHENANKPAEQPIHNMEGKAVSAAVSKDGKTRIISTGQEANIREIASIEEGSITFRMEDGSLVEASDISYGSKGEALIYDTVASLGVNPQSANELVNMFDASGKVPASVYAKGIEDAFRYGKWGAPRNDMKQGPAARFLTESQRKHAYEIGRETAKEQAGSKQEQKKQESARKKGRKEPGKVHFEGDATKLTGKQKTNLRALETIADALGVQICVFEGKTAPDGVTRIGANGWYDSKDGSIHIDLYAGADGKGTMLFTAAHELTHLIKDQSPAKFKALSDFLMEQYGKQGTSVQQLVENQIEKAKNAGYELDYDGAFEEVVADSMESMLADGKVLQELKRQDKSLWQTVKDYVLELCEKIRKAYKGLKPDSLEGRMVAEMRDAAEEMRRRFTEGLLDAGENLAGSEGQKNSTLEGGTRMQIREIGNSGKFYVQADRQVLTGTEPKVWKKQIEKYINDTIRKEQDVAIPAADGHVLLLTGRSAYKLSEQHVASIGKKIQNLLPDDAYARKGRVATHIDELIQVAKFREYKPDQFQKHENDIGEAGFNYYEANFMDFDGKYYRIRFSAGINANEETVYSVGQIRERRLPADGGSSSKTEALKNGRKPSNSIIYTSEEKSQELKSAVMLAYEKALKEKLSSLDSDKNQLSKGATGKEKTTQKNGSVKYSLREFEDGTRFVDVQMDAHEFDGLTVAEMNRKAKVILMDKFVGRVIGIDNQVFVNGDSVNEYLHPSKSIDIDSRKAKLTASGELDNLLDAGVALPNQPDGRDGHVHPDAIDFSYFKTTFKIGSEYFEGIVNVKNIKRGKLLKDVTKIRNITEDIVSSYGQNPKSNFLHDASIDSIRSSEEDVKQKFSLRDQDMQKRSEVPEKEDGASFARQLSEYEKGKRPRGEALTVGNTPKVFREIGLSNVPVTISTDHVDFGMYGAKAMDPNRGATVFGQLSESVKKPIAVFTSQGQMIALLPFTVKGKQVVTPFVVEAAENGNTLRIYDTFLGGAFGKTREAGRLLYDGLKAEKSGMPTMLYVNKKEAEALLKQAGLSMRGALTLDGFVRRMENEGESTEADTSTSAKLSKTKNYVNPETNSAELDETVLLKNAAGHEIITVTKTDITGEPGSITQYTATKGGIERNYYGDDGRQYKQVSNNDHGRPDKHPYGKHGEHVHDYIYDETGKLIGRPMRELTDLEREENGDIL